MKRSLRQNLGFFHRANSLYRWGKALQAWLWHDEYTHTLYLPTPNLYRERDLGHQTVAGQRVRCKQVTDTAGTSFFIVGDEFALPILT